MSDAAELLPLLKEAYCQSLTGMMVLGPEQRVELWNRWLEKVSGIDASEARGRTLTELFPELLESRCHQAVAGALHEGTSALLSLSLNRSPFPLFADEGARQRNERLHQQIYVMPLALPDRPRHCLVQIFDVSAAVAREALLRSQAFELRRSAYHDGLTGLPNRRRFDEAFDADMRQAFRKQHPVSLVMVDIDYFKDYNDRYGHLQGDQCLRQVADIIGAFARRPTDLASRFGGEEFGLIFPETDLSDAQRLAEGLRQAVEAARIPHAASPLVPWVTVSIGVASKRPSSETPTDLLLSRADKALYDAKGAGRNRVGIWNGEPDA
ncbi:MAG: diguanylate cyclase [Rhodocyclaceae bacterium]|nr:diguanylate cyclase [Rhodocyclaceae bacterium]